MKRILLIVATLAASSAFAQDDDGSSASGGGSRADAGSFGLRVGSSHLFPSTGGVADVEGRLFLTESLALDLGLGFQLTVAGGATVGFSAGGGVTYFFAGNSSFRPFLTGGFGIGVVPVAAANVVGLSFNAGGGGEYWFSRNFSMAGRALLIVVPQFNVGTTIAILSPGVAFTWYFN